MVMTEVSVGEELDSLPLDEAPPRPERPKPNTYPDLKTCQLHGMWYFFSCYYCDRSPSTPQSKQLDSLLENQQSERVIGLNLFGV
jgi:hypothetical protein